MCVRVCTCTDPPSPLLPSSVYDRHPWPQPIRLTAVEDLLLVPRPVFWHEKSIYPPLGQAGAIMPVITPSYPVMTCTHRSASRRSGIGSETPSGGTHGDECGRGKVGVDGFFLFSFFFLQCFAFKMCSVGQCTKRILLSEFKRGLDITNAFTTATAAAAAIAATTSSSLWFLFCV